MGRATRTPFGYSLLPPDLSTSKMKHLEFKRWNEFRAYIDEDQQVLPVYWRGQRDPNWVLASPFEREVLGHLAALRRT